MSTVLDEVQWERDTQDLKWGEQNHANGTGPGVLLLGEVVMWRQYVLTMNKLATAQQAATDRNTDDGTLTYADILLEEVFEAVAEDDPEKLREELVQVAAVAVAWVEKIDRDKVRGL